MGNSSGNIHKYWEAIDSTFGLQGGFIWEWVDQVTYPWYKKYTDDHQHYVKYWIPSGDNRFLSLYIGPIEGKCRW